MPSFASSRKQIRQRSKSRMYPRTLPHRKQRLATRDLYFGFLFERARTDFFAITRTRQQYKPSRASHHPSKTSHAASTPPEIQRNLETQRKMCARIRLWLPDIENKKCAKSLAGSTPIRPGMPKMGSGAHVHFLNGNPRWRRNASASFLFFAVVTIVIARPKTSLSSSSAVSGKTICSRMPNV